MKLSPVTWEQWHHHLRVESRTPVQLDCPRLFVPQSVHCIWLLPVKDTKQTMRTQREGGGRGVGGYTGIITLSNCTQTRESLIAPAQNLTRLSHVRSLQTWSHLAGFSRLRCWNWCDCVWNKHLSSSALTQPLFFSHSGPMWTAALRATKAVPKLDLHVNQMDAAWVEYLPGLEIRCK